MMAAYRLRGLGWFASCAGFVLAFYLVSLQVATERNRLDALNGRIRAAERDIRALETEFDTRANLQQLEKWNGDILALSAPVAGQFVTSEAQFAAISFDAPLASQAGEGEVRTAALVVPALPAFEAPAAQQVAAAITAEPRAQAAHAIARASVTSNAIAAAKAATAPAGRVAAKPEPQRVAMLDGDLLSDLSARARAEAARR